MDGIRHGFDGYLTTTTVICIRRLRCPTKGTERNVHLLFMFRFTISSFSLN